MIKHFFMGAKLVLETQYFRLYSQHSVIIDEMSNFFVNSRLISKRGG